MLTTDPLLGVEQQNPSPGEKDLHECRWKPSYELTIPKDWTSGVYLGRMTTIPESADEPYWQSYVIFVVNDDRPCDILVQCSDNTWQAYNQWPSKYSVYTHPKGNQGPWADVSFDRPYAKYAQIYENPQSVGSGEWQLFDIARDPGETRDLRTSYPEDFARLLAAYRKFERDEGVLPLPEGYSPLEQVSRNAVRRVILPELAGPAVGLLGALALWWLWRRRRRRQLLT
jgi:hypothetical protein